MAKKTTEFQVYWTDGDLVEIHVFKTERGARKFAATVPQPVIYEGGIVGRSPAYVRRVVRHS